MTFQGEPFLINQWLAQYEGEIRLHYDNSNYLVGEILDKL